MMKRAGRAVVVISVACAMLLTSCATAFVKRAPLRPVQLMGEEGTLVITVDAVSEAELVRLAFGGIEELGARSQRISLALSSESSPIRQIWMISPNGRSSKGIIPPCW